MADYAISSADLSGISRSLNTINNNINTLGSNLEVIDSNVGQVNDNVKVVYDENVIGLEALLKYYFMIIDPVSYNRQGADSGIQYRTGIYYTDAEDLPVIEAYYNKLEQDELRQSGEYFAVELKPLECFYPAEEKHQKYLYKNPGGYCHIFPKYFKLNDSEKAKS